MLKYKTKSCFIMHSIRTRTTLLTVIGISVAIFVATVISAVSVANMGHKNAEQSLALLCETGKNSINYYFKSVEQSVNTVSNLIDADLDAINDNDYIAGFAKHMDDARTIFEEAANNTNGVLTYYYRIDPEISDVTNEKGFWYTNLDGKGFVEHEVTDISDDQFECVWFYTPKNTGRSVWLPPYITDNLDVYVLSYNVPVYRSNTFIGVVGIEISYTTIGEQIKDIKVQNTGCAFIIENEHHTIIYHPFIDLLNMPEDQRPPVPDGLQNAIENGEHHAEYIYDGVTKHCYWLNLSNDMSIVVAVPLSEVNKSWTNVIIQMIVVAAVIIAVFTTISILYTRRITKPLKELTNAAEEINKGNYQVKLDYKNDDEIGVLTTTVNKLISHLGEYIDDLNNLAYADSLTSVNNKSAFDVAVQNLQEKIDNPEEKIEFAIGVFDCDDLKQINDKYGHDKGNVYLKNSSHLISRVFQHSEVYRVGGDEFIIILQNEDYLNRKSLEKTFIEKSEEICAFAKEEWEKIKVSVGIARYDSEIDKTVQDVIVHADHLMYENKRERKKKNK